MIETYYPDVNKLVDTQKTILLDILSPLLRQRYKEKFDALHVDSNWLKDAEVDLPLEYHSKENNNYNTLLRMRFPKSHPLFKGQLQLLYRRAELHEYFPEWKNDIEITYEELFNLAYHEYLPHWQQYLGKQFGIYVEHFSRLYYQRRYDMTLRLDEKHLIFFIPPREKLREYFDFGLFKQNEGIFEIDVIVDNSYVILPKRETLRVRVYRENPVDTTKPNQDFYDANGNKIKHHAHTWFGN